MLGRYFPPDGYSDFWAKYFQGFACCLVISAGLSLVIQRDRRTCELSKAAVTTTYPTCCWLTLRSENAF
jgi:hypothetical protein